MEGMGSEGRVEWKEREEETGLHFTTNHRENQRRAGSGEMVLSKLSPRGRLPKFSFRSPNRDSPSPLPSPNKIVFRPCRQSALQSPRPQPQKAKQQRVGELRRVVSERRLRAEGRYEELRGRLEALKREYESQEHGLRIINSTIAEHF